MVKEPEKMEKKPYAGEETPEEEEAEEEVSKEMEEESEEEEEKKKKKKMVNKEESEEDMEKSEGENPEEDTAAATESGSTTSPNMGVPSTQDVFTPSSNVRVGRESHSVSSMGQSPSEVTYGKSVNPDLMKSPLFIGLSKQLEALQKSFDKKLSEMEKSFNDRIANMNKSVKDAEANFQKFYSQPFYKSPQTNATEEIETLSKKVSKGQVRYSD